MKRLKIGKEILLKLDCAKGQLGNKRLIRNPREK